MATALIPLAIGILTTILFQVYKRQKIKFIELSPNCLLTKYPIIFINTNRTFLTREPKELTYLRAHGYDATLIPYTKNASRLQNSLSQLAEVHTKIHLFYPNELTLEMSALLKKYPDFFASHQKTEAKPIKEYLEYAISLAEKDFQCSH